MDDGQQMKKKESIRSLRCLPSWQEMEIEASRIGLEGCETFQMLDDETKEKEWNGIGADRFPKKLRDALDNLFKEALSAAYIHDLRFVLGGTKKQFHATNSELRRNLKKCLRYYRSHYSLIGYWLTRLEIDIAVHLCNKYGYEGWHKKNENNN